MKKSSVFLIAFLTAFVLSNAVVIPVLISTGMFYDKFNQFTFSNYIRWELFIFITFMLLASVMFSHKFANGRVQEALFIISSVLVISELVGYVLFTLLECQFDFTVVDWFGSLDSMITSALYYGIVFGIAVLFLLIYCLLINRNFIKIFEKTGVNTSGKLKQVKDSNLENSRWMTEKEKKEVFKVYEYSKLDQVTKDGVPVGAELENKGKDMQVVFNSPCHSIVIGSTGSGKTTTFVSPMIQLLGATKAGSSMVITDPKGELFGMHSKYLKERGYDVTKTKTRLKKATK